MANGQETGQQYAQRVQQWIAERDAVGDYVEYERAGKINRAALCAELDFGRSVVTQNPIVRECLAEAEGRWFGNKEQDSKAHAAARERSEKRVAQTNADISKLQDEVAKLKAQNSILRRQLEKYEAMDAVIRSTGIAPR